MNTEEIQSALIDRLSGIGINPVLPNMDFTGARPYAEILAPITTREGGGLAGNEWVTETGRLPVNLVVDAGTGTEIVNGHAATVSELFPQGLRLLTPSGITITITRPADVRGGFRDGPEWKVPVFIFYEATT